eukprot:s1536_g17.t1
MPKESAMQCCCWAAVSIAEALKADDALSLSRVDSRWRAELGQPSVWQRYLNGSPELLARNVLADNNTGELFVGPSVHPENYRAIVAALRQPGWFRHYQGMKRLVSSGQLKEQLGGPDGVIKELRRNLRARQATAGWLRCLQTAHITNTTSEEDNFRSVHAANTAKEEAIGCSDATEMSSSSATSPKREEHAEGSKESADDTAICYDAKPTEARAGRNSAGGGVRCSPNPSMPESLELLLVFVFFLVFLGEFSEEHRSKKKLQFTWQFVAADTSPPSPSVKTARPYAGATGVQAIEALFAGWKRIRRRNEGWSP